MKVFTFIDQDGHVIGRLASEHDRGEYQLDEINEAWQVFRNELWSDFGDLGPYYIDSIVDFRAFYNTHFNTCKLDLIDWHSIIEP